MFSYNYLIFTWKLGAFNMVVRRPSSNCWSISASCPSMSGFSISRVVVLILLYHLHTRSRFSLNCRSVSFFSNRDFAASGTDSLALISRYFTSRNTATSCTKGIQFKARRLWEKWFSFQQMAYELTSLKINVLCFQRVFEWNFRHPHLGDFVSSVNWHFWIL